MFDSSRFQGFLLTKRGIVLLVALWAIQNAYLVTLGVIIASYALKRPVMYGRTLH